MSRHSKLTAREAYNEAYRLIRKRVKAVTDPKGNKWEVLNGKMKRLAQRHSTIVMAAENSFDARVWDQPYWLTASEKIRMNRKFGVNPLTPRR